MASVRASARGPEKACTWYYDRVQANPPRPGPCTRGAYLLHPNTFRFFFHFYLIFIAFFSIYGLFYVLRVNYYI